MGDLFVYHGDITKLNVDAIVNAANENLLGSGGVDGAIHSAAGPELLEASQRLAPCPTGEARLTPGFRLQARFVIHAVGPIYQDGNFGERESLQKTYRSALQIAESNRFESIAFPCISTGAYGYPQEEASELAVESVCEWLLEKMFPKKVLFCCFESRDVNLYSRLLDVLGITEYRIQ